ncbi:MAG: hypothetical protein KF753_08115 [Caldilineaceae bacterium]|nr:hypothetical protein [Caldilineaceae bacterium]
MKSPTSPQARSFPWRGHNLRWLASTLLVSLALAVGLLASLGPAQAAAVNSPLPNAASQPISQPYNQPASPSDDSVPPVAQTEPVAASYFDTGREGWRVDGDVQAGSGVPAWLPQAGHPGGHLRATDDVEGGTWYWEAPPKFLGDISAAYSRTLSFDLRQDAEMNSQFSGPDVIISGGSSALIYNTAFNPRKRWTEYSIPLSADAGWMKIGVAEPISTAVGVRASAEDIQAVLQDVRNLRIRGEFENGWDEGFLDNVVLGGEAKQPRVDVLSGLQTQLVVGDLSLLVDFPGGAVSETLYLRSGVSAGHAGPAGMGQMGNSFFIDAYTSGGGQVHQFLQPFTLTLSTARVEQQEVHIFRPHLAYWDEDKGVWESIPTAYDPASGLLTATLDHLTEFALFGALRGEIFLPVTAR